MYDVVLSESYLTSLIDCAIYIKEQLGNPTAAERLLDDAERVAMSLADMPHRQPYSRYPSLAAQGICVVPVNNHCILYSVDEQAKKVMLHMFGYATRNWEALL